MWHNRRENNNQTVVLKFEEDEEKLLRIVKQKYIFFPILFNLYSEHIFREALNNMDEGILINGIKLNEQPKICWWYIEFADTTQGLQKLMDRITDASALYGRDQVRIERVPQCQYLAPV